eukprot:Gb_13665 [translate_table: standard]
MRELVVRSRIHGHAHLMIRTKKSKHGFLLYILAIFLLLFILPWRCRGKVFVDYIEPDFTATQMQFVDDLGAFVASMNGTFYLKFYNPTTTDKFYLCIMHAESNLVVWSANRASPISNSEKFKLTTNGAVIQNSDGRTLWSATIATGMSISRMQLRENGNLVLLNAANDSLWESFDNPTDTLLFGQFLKPGSMVISSKSQEDYSHGDYAVLLNEKGLVLIWGSSDTGYQTYWSMARDSRAVQLGVSNNNNNISYALVERSGLNIYSKSNSSANSSVFLQITTRLSTLLRLARIDPWGHFQILSYVSGTWVSDFSAVNDGCRMPAACGPLGICKSLTPAGSHCSCPLGLETINQSDNSQGCRVHDPPQCANYTEFLSTKSIQFLNIKEGVDYFANQFVSPILTPSIGACQEICRNNCSCIGFFFMNSSNSCYVHERLGTLRSTGNPEHYAYVKVLRTEIEPNKSSKGFSVLAIVLGLAGAIIGLVGVLGIGYFCWRKIHRKTSKTGFSDSADEELLRSIPGLPTRFSYTALQTATQNFAHKIGAGGFGAVYEGRLPDRTKVAVKMLQSVGQGNKEFYSEIAIIGTIHHVNLVKLRGFCVEGSNRLLVYEFMNRGSLDRSLFGPGRPVLEWDERFNIALGTARGLAYLHYGCRQKIIHCDIKPENILLDDKSEAKVSDFGLAKLLTREQSQAFTTMRGTRGYLAPEWLTNSAISDKTDVYSYGMLLLEIVGGRKNCHSPSDGVEDPSDQSLYFPAYALQMSEQGRYVELADPRLEGRVCSEGVEKLVKIALCCVQEDLNLRPSMSKVVHMLEGNVGVEEPRVDSLMFLQFYARRFNSPVGTPMVFPPSSSCSSASWMATNKNSPPTTGTASTSSSQRYQTVFSIISSSQLSGPR